MTRTLLVTAAELAAGWIVRPGDLCHSVRCAWSGPPPWPDHDCRCKGQMQPPADLVAAAAPCETCRGSRWDWASAEDDMEPNDPRLRCPDCRIELLGECQRCCGTGTLKATAEEQRIMADPTLRIHSCLWCNGDGAVTLGYAYPVGDVLPIIGANDDRPPGRHIAPAWLAGGDIWFLCDEHLHDVKDITDSFPGSPALVGQYALQIVLLGA